MDNPFIERFNGRLRDESLNTELCFSVLDTWQTLLEWQRGYNEVRPDSPVGRFPSGVRDRVAVIPDRTR